MPKTVRWTDGQDHELFKMGSEIFRTSPVVSMPDDYWLTVGFDLFDRVRTDMSVWKLSDFLAKDYRFQGEALRTASRKEQTKIRRTAGFIVRHVGH